jgi:hypothetical protein
MQKNSRVAPSTSPKKVGIANKGWAVLRKESARVRLTTMQRQDLESGVAMPRFEHYILHLKGKQPSYSLKLPKDRKSPLEGLDLSPCPPAHSLRSIFQSMVAMAHREK